MALSAGSWLMGVLVFISSKLDSPSCISWSEDTTLNPCRPVTGTVVQPCNRNKPARLHTITTAQRFQFNRRCNSFLRP